MTDVRQQLADAARLFYQRGWMMGTAGNLSARDPDAPARFFITGSGLQKGALTIDDFVHCTLDSETVEPGRPGLRASAETSIHEVLYAHTDAGAVLHVHTVAATVAARLGTGNALRLPPLEMLKGFGIRDEAPEIDLPLFHNHAHVPQIAADLAEALPMTLPVLLIRDHGVTTWGPDIATALNRLELIQFLLDHLVTSTLAGAR